MKTTEHATVNDSSLTMQVHRVSLLNVNGGRFAEIAYGITGEMSVLLNEADPVASLFASADAEFAAASAAKRRAMRMRNAAWFLSKERTTAQARRGKPYAGHFEFAENTFIDEEQRTNNAGEIVDPEY